MIANSKVLSVVVPITKMAGNLEHLETWLSEIDPGILEVFIIHDVQDSETGNELRGILAKLQLKEIKLIENSFGSPGAARNAGLILCSSPWIAFWDGDDFPLVDEFLAMILQAKKHDAEIAIGGFSITSDRRLDSLENVFLPSLGEWGSNIPFNPGLWRWAFKREKIQEIKFNSFLMGEDQCFLFEIRPLTKKIYIHSKSVYRYTIYREGQLTRDRKAINEIVLSLRYLVLMIQNRREPLNYFELIIILKQSVTSMKKGKISTKLYAMILLLKISLKAILNRNTSIITVMRSIFLFVILKKNNIPQEKNMIMIGGLGNQLFQLNTGLNVSRDERLVLNYSFKDLLSSSSTQISEFNIPQHVQMLFGVRFNFIVRKFINLSIRVSSKAGDLKKSRYLGKFFINRLQSTLSWFYPGSWKINNGVGYDKSILEKEYSNYLGYFQSYPNINPYLENELRLLSPSSAYLELQSKLIDHKSLVVHIRLGDYAKEKSFGTPSREYFSESIEELWLTGHYVRICLYSNDLEKAKTYIPANLMRYLWTAQQEDVSDAETLELMRHGSGYVISNSSFSWWAARLSYDSNARVICPNPWFENKEEPHLLIPIHWERRDA
jgi:glycosyltransferase involved in cell wall biosynthesis